MFWDNNDKDTINHITELLEVPSKRIKLGRSARAHICENFYQNIEINIENCIWIL